MTKIDRIFEAWDDYCMTFDTSRRPGGLFWTEEDRRIRNQARSDLDRLKIEWYADQDGKSYGVCGCIVLSRPTSFCEGWK